MRPKSSFAAFLMGASLLCLPAFSQESPKGSEVSVQFFGAFVNSTNQDGVRQTSSDSGGVLASYGFFFTSHQGVEVNYGYSRSTQSYDSGNGPEGVSADRHEITAAYVYRIPMGRVTPFVEAGTGALVFDPRGFAGASTQGRAAFLYGAGADYNVTKRFFVRGQYRGLVYSSPTFDLVGDYGAGRVTNLAEPSIGFGFRL